MALADALKVLNKEMKEALEYDIKLEGITTGSIAVDYIAGNGGFPRRRCSEVFGWESSGKTTLCVSACANAQRRGLTAAYLDMEKALDLSWAEKIGFNFKDETKGLYLSPNSFEQGMIAVNELALAGTDLIVVDSVPALVPESELKGDIDAGIAIGLKSRMMAQFLSRITKVISEHNNALVLINQMRAKINTSPGSRWEPTEQSAGGSALKFFTSLRIDMTQVKKQMTKEMDPFTNTEIDVPISSLHRAQAFKNKVATPYRKCQFFIKYGQNGVFGIDNLQTIIDLAKYKGVIKQAGGGNYSYTGAAHNFALRGTDELYLHLSSPDAAELRKEIRSSIGL